MELLEQIKAITTSDVKCTYRHPKTGEMIESYIGKATLLSKPLNPNLISVEPHERPRYRDLPENQESELDRQWRIDGQR